MAPTHRRLAAFYAAYLAALGAFSPYFPLFLDAQGLSAVAISTLMSLWYGTRIVAPSAWGWLTQNSARPIRWLRGGALLTLLCFAGFTLEGLPWIALLAVMAAFSFFYNAIMPQFEAITLSHLSAEPQRYGRIRLWGSVGFLVTAFGFGPMFDALGIGWLPWAMLPLFALVVWGACVNDYGPPLPDDRARESLATSLRRPGLAALITAGFLMQVAHGPYYVFFSLHLAEHGYSRGALGGFWAVGVFAEILMFWFAGRLLERHGAVVLMRWCMAIAALRFALTALLPGAVPVLLFAQTGHAASFGLYHAASMQRVARLFPGRLLGQGQGLLYGLGSGVGGVAGAMLAGAMWQLGGGRAAFLAAALAACAGLVVTLRAMQPGDARTRPRNLALTTDEAQ